MLRYLRIFRAFALTEFQFEMEYRGNLYLSIFEMFLVIGTSIGAVLIMFGHTTTMNGWTLPQMIVLLGVYYVIQGGVSLLFALSLVFGVMLVYSLLLGLVTLSFWFVRVENLLAIFWAFTEAGRFPVDVYPLWLR